MANQRNDRTTPRKEPATNANRSKCTTRGAGARVSVTAMIALMNAAPVWRNPSEFAVCTVIANFQNDRHGGWAWPTIAKIATKVQLTERQVMRILEELSIRGVIEMETVRQGRAARRSRSLTRYRLQFAHDTGVMSNSHSAPDTDVMSNDGPPGDPRFAHDICDAAGDIQSAAPDIGDVAHDIHDKLLMTSDVGDHANSFDKPADSAPQLVRSELLDLELGEETRKSELGGCAAEEQRCAFSPSQENQNHNKNAHQADRAWPAPDAATRQRVRSLVIRALNRDGLRFGIDAEAAFISDLLAECAVEGLNVEPSVIVSTFYLVIARHRIGLTA